MRGNLPGSNASPFIGLRWGGDVRDRSRGGRGHPSTKGETRPAHYERVGGRAERTTAPAGSACQTTQRSPASTRSVPPRSQRSSTCSKRAFTKDDRAAAFGERADARGSATSNLSHRACGSTERTDARGSTTSNLSHRACGNTERTDARTESDSPHRKPHPTSRETACLQSEAPSFVTVRYRKKSPAPGTSP